VNAAWNHNIEYQKVVRRALGTRVAKVLDVGTGDGFLAAELASLGHHVTAIDADEPTLTRARSRWGAANIDFLLGDFMAYPFEPASFDAVVSIAALHHMAEGDALARMAGLLRPGGTLCVVGLARSRTPVDVLWDIAGAVATRMLRRRHGGHLEVVAPTTWPPPSTYRAIRRLAEATLPTVRYRRHMMWRYSLIWTKSGTWEAAA
jgi:2-polyprenyl-3-methyl-5-hydroxy-6-metoxy-1,4-benzoquinol methylase